MSNVKCCHDSVVSLEQNRMYLDFPKNPSAFHPAGHVHRVTPDIILRLLRSDYPRDHGAVVYS